MKHTASRCSTILYRNCAAVASLTLAVLLGATTGWAQEPIATPAATNPDRDADDAHAPGAQDLSGRWVYLEQITTVSDLMVIGETYSTTRAVALYDLVQSGHSLRGAGTLCSLKMKTDSRFIDSSLPAAFTRSVQVPDLELELMPRSKSVAVRQPRQFRVLGVHLENPATDALPTTASDSRVHDQDRDGHPGVTVVVSGMVDGELHLVQRQWNELDGALIGPDRIEGAVRFGREERVLGTTNSVLSDPPVAKAVYRRSFFKLVRLPEGTTCGNLTRAFERF